MGQALYRKYRSKSLKDVVGQEHVTKTLEQAIKQNRISHAYLFTGPRGVGKTSVARILAHEINNLPYTDDSAHIDIIEIDAASNRRIDEIRDLRDKVHIAPTSAKYKVYIIDEVHMLTREAFNALLKTLEEPPEHVVFILATTDVHKLPDTIISRTQRFHFQPGDSQSISDLLTKVAASEKIEVTPEALSLLAEHSDGSFRDSLSLLDQARSYGPIVEAETVQQLLGLPPKEAIEALLTATFSGDHSMLVRQLSDLYNQGFQAAMIAKQLGQLIRSAIVEQSSGDDYDIKLELLGKLVDVPSSYDPERYLEIILLQAVPMQVKEKETVQPSSAEHKAITVEKPAPAEEIEKPPKKADTKVQPTKALSNEELLPALLDVLKKKHNTLYGVIRMAKTTFIDENTLQLSFGFAFHQKKVNEAANRQLLFDIVENLTKRKLTIEFIVDPSSTPTKITSEPAASPPDDTDLSTISNIFSGAELLES